MILQHKKRDRCAVKTESLWRKDAGKKVATAGWGKESAAISFLQFPCLGDDPFYQAGINGYYFCTWLPD